MLMTTRCSPLGASTYSDSRRTSGKKRPLLAAPPLRTVRASFPAYSSSFCKPSRMGEPAVSSLLTLGWIWIVAVGVPGADLTILTMD